MVFFRLRTKAAYSLLGHMGAVLGYTASMQWLEEQDLAMVVLANVGTMHVGQALPNAASIAVNAEFIATAIDCAQQSFEHDA